MNDVPHPADPQELMREFLAQRETIFAFLMAHARDPHVAEDVFQDVGVSVIQAAAKGTVPDSPIAWFMTLAKSRLIDHVRREQRHHRHLRSLDVLGEVIAQSLTEHPQPATEHHEHLRHLRACLDTLGHRARAILDHRYQDGASSARIAELMGWSEPAVRVALTRTRRALADCVERRRRSGA